MALNKQSIDRFKSELLSRRLSIVNSLHQTNAEMINDDLLHADAIDQASADSDKTLTMHIKNRDAQVVVEIDEALRRIEAGGFGDCENCGEEIAMPRLQANPASTLCIDCKAELESGRFSRRA